MKVFDMDGKFNRKKELRILKERE